MLSDLIITTEQKQLSKNKKQIVKELLTPKPTKNEMDLTTCCLRNSCLQLKQNKRKQ